jgi:hypothetical protein
MQLECWRSKQVALLESDQNCTSMLPSVVTANSGSEGGRVVLHCCFPEAVPVWLLLLLFSAESPLPAGDADLLIEKLSNC